MTDLIPAPRAVDGPAATGFVRLTAHPSSWPPGTGTEGTERWLRATARRAPPGCRWHRGRGPTTHGDGIELRLDRATSAPEGYRLVVDADAASTSSGGGPAGVFWGAQTLRQLLGPDAFRRAPLGRDRAVAAAGIVTIEDAPRFRWRGLMLDVARHFMPKDGVLRYLDLMAAHKLNVFHFHLTDDQGWRIEIKRYPKLTEIGSWRARTKFGHRASPLWEEKPHGGFYTQDDIREIVAYAAERHITVVPEIDIPGHSQAAIAAYPELGNTDVIDTTSLSVWDTWGINPNVLAPTDNTLRFYEGVFEEVLDLFPSAAVHPHRRRRVRQGPVAGVAHRAGADRGTRARGRGRAPVVVHPALRQLAGRARAPADRLGRDPGGRPRPGRRRVLLARLRGRHHRRPGGPRRRHVPRAAGVLGPPSGRAAPTSRCPSATCAPWRTSTASSPFRRS